jgi:hypothetical protein
MLGLDARSPYVKPQLLPGHVESWMILFVTIICWVLLVQSGWVGGILQVILVEEIVSTAHKVFS